MVKKQKTFEGVLKNGRLPYLAPVRRKRPLRFGRIKTLSASTSEERSRTSRFQKDFEIKRLINHGFSIQIFNHHRIRFTIVTMITPTILIRIHGGSIDPDPPSPFPPPIELLASPLRLGSSREQTVLSPVQFVYSVTSAVS